MQRGFLTMAILIVLGTACLAGDLPQGPIKLTAGLWEFTDLLRNFSISADGQREIESGGSGPNTARACIRQFNLGSGSIYPGLRNPKVAAHCKATTISETSDSIDSVVECSADSSPYIDHTVVIAPTSKSYTIIRDTTFMEPNYDGSISRSTMYVRARWIKDDCDK